MGRGISYKRLQNERIIRKRRKIWSNINPEWAKKSIQGKFRKNNFSCGCSGCKPHKYGIEPKYKASELKRLEEET